MDTNFKLMQVRDHRVECHLRGTQKRLADSVAKRILERLIEEIRGEALVISFTLFHRTYFTRERLSLAFQKRGSLRVLVYSKNAGKNKSCSNVVQTIVWIAIQ